MIKHYDTQAPSGGGGGEEGEGVMQLCNTLAKEVCPNEVYGPFPKEWEKSKSRMEFIEGAKNGALAMYRHLTPKKEPVLPWLKDLIEMAEDGDKLHRSNAVHQEFLQENRDTLREAKSFLRSQSASIPSSLPEKPNFPRWVRATSRLPDPGKKVVIFRYTTLTGYIEVGHNGPETMKILLRNADFYINLEWLEETESIPYSLPDGERNDKKQNA